MNERKISNSIGDLFINTPATHTSRIAQTTNIEDHVTRLISTGYKIDNATKSSDVTPDMYLDEILYSHSVDTSITTGLNSITSMINNTLKIGMRTATIVHSPLGVSSPAYPHNFQNLFVFTNDNTTSMYTASIMESIINSFRYVRNNYNRPIPFLEFSDELAFRTLWAREMYINAFLELPRQFEAVYTLDKLYSENGIGICDGKASYYDLQVRTLLGDYINALGKIKTIDGPNLRYYYKLLKVTTPDPLSYGIPSLQAFTMNMYKTIPANMTVLNGIMQSFAFPADPTVDIHNNPANMINYISSLIVALNTFVNETTEIERYFQAIVRFKADFKIETIDDTGILDNIFTGHEVCHDYTITKLMNYLPTRYDYEDGSDKNVLIGACIINQDTIFSPQGQMSIVINPEKPLASYTTEELMLQGVWVHRLLEGTNYFFDKIFGLTTTQWSSYKIVFTDMYSANTLSMSPWVVQRDNGTLLYDAVNMIVYPHNVYRVGEPHDKFDYTSNRPQFQLFFNLVNKFVNAYGMRWLVIGTNKDAGVTDTDFLYLNTLAGDIYTNVRTAYVLKDIRSISSAIARDIGTGVLSQRKFDDKLPK